MKYNIAVLGATGSVGQKILMILEERKFPVDKLFCLASSNSAGKLAAFGKNEHKVMDANEFNFKQVDLVISSISSSASQEIIPKIAKAGCVVIDNSSAFRMVTEIPLVVPEVNKGEIANFEHSNIIANPNCVALPLSLVLNALSKYAKVKRVVVSTYQSVSGAGTEAMDELFNQTKAKYMNTDISPEVFEKPIAFNLIPKIGDFNEGSYTEEEEKIMQEPQKILGYNFEVTATSVRVPVFVGHSISANIEFESEIEANKAKDLLRSAPGIILYDNEEEERVITPKECVGDDEIYVSRVRNDKTQKNTLNLWIVADNLRKGAALNAVQIAEELANNYL